MLEIKFQHHNELLLVRFLVGQSTFYHRFLCSNQSPPLLWPSQNTQTRQPPQTNSFRHRLSNIQPCEVCNFHHHGQQLISCEELQALYRDDQMVVENEVMVSFDVQSLFTNVPIRHALEVIHQRLLEDETLEDKMVFTADQVILLLRICLQTTHFVYNHQFYEQTE